MNLMNLERIYQHWERKTLNRGHREGKAEGKAEAVLAVLAARGLTVTVAQRKQVLACTDNAVLGAWLRAVATIPSTKALLSGRAPSRRRAAATTSIRR
jgi:hypothetical protein